MSSKLESDVCCHVYGLRHLAKSTEVTAGLVESNGSLLPGGWLKVICRLTACTSGSGPGSTLGNKYRRTFNFFILPAGSDTEQFQMFYIGRYVLA